MKKSLLFGAAAVLIAAATSCGGSNSGDLTKPTGLSNFTDSLAYYSGTADGSVTSLGIL